MIIKPLEEFETARYLKYQRDIIELGTEFESWAKKLQEKYFGELTGQQKEEMLFRVTDDARYVVAMDIRKLLGSKQ